MCVCVCIDTYVTVYVTYCTYYVHLYIYIYYIWHINMFLHSCLLMEIDIFDDSSSTKVETQKNGFD